MPCKDGGRCWSHVATNQKMPMINGHPQKLGRGRGTEARHVESQRERGLADTLKTFQTSSLHNCKRINFCCFKQPGL